MARPIAVLQLTPEERSELQPLVRAPTTSQRDGLRARVVLLRGEGLNEKDVAEQLATSVTTVSLWSRRFGRNRLEGLRDKPGRGRKPWLPPEKIQKVITQLRQPPQGRRRWSVRTMAKAVGISHDSVHRIWRQNDLKPHLTRTFKLSQDPEFVAQPGREVFRGPNRGVCAGGKLHGRAAVDSSDRRVPDGAK